MGTRRERVRVRVRSQDTDGKKEKKNTDIDLSQEGIRHLHAVCAASPRSGDASSVLRGARLVIRRRHVRRVEHEDVDRFSEATRQRTREGRDERFE